MRSRFCKNFTSGVPVSFNTNTSYINTYSVNFSAEFWQPFIDLTIVNENAFICGPLLGIAIEISKIMKSDLTYIKTPNGEYDEDFEMMGQKMTNMLLTPFPPMSVNMTNVSQYMQFSRFIGDVAMISILSSKEPIDSLFHLIHIFDFEIWLSLVVSYFLISSLSALISGDFKIFMDYIAIVLRQDIKKFSRKHRTSLITIIWFYATMILMWAFSGMLLTFLVFTNPYEKIDSIHELSEKDIEFTVFEGENALEYINDPKEPYYEKFLNRCVVEDPANEVKEKWEKTIFEKISEGIYALVSDQLFLDYYFATKLLNYSNLYRSESNQLVLPYFLPLAKHNSQELIVKINQLICNLVESGLFETWLKDTLDRNNDALRLGFYEKVEQKYQYTPLLLNQFKSLFYVQIIAFLLSSIILILEVIYLRLKTVQNRNFMTKTTKFRDIHRRKTFLKQYNLKSSH